MSVEKLERNGEIAVLVSRGFGAGWSTWNSELGEAIIFDKEMAQALLDGGTDAALIIAEQKYPDAYHGGVRDLIVEWVPKGQRFTISEYDGSESLVILAPDYGFVA